MSLRCLETNGERYKENKQFVEDMLKYFPDYNFDIMKATISGWQSSQLKDDEDRLPTIEELIDYLQDSAKKQRNDNLLNIANKAQDILANDFNKEYQEILAKAPRDSEGRLLAPNGKPSNLTERQYAQVRSKAFKKWFGNWENNPENASKVVDENGEPLVVYHGTREKGITIFKAGYFGNKHIAYSYANYAAPDPNDYNIIGFNVEANSEDAKWADFKSIEEFYEVTSGDIIPAFLNIRNPIISDNDIHALDRTSNREAYINKHPNNDGIMSKTEFADNIDNLYDRTVSKQYAAFRPNQIKSAESNIGTFSTRM